MRLFVLLLAASAIGCPAPIAGEDGGSIAGGGGTATGGGAATGGGSAVPVQGTLDLADGASCRLAGWARDPNTVSSLQVHLYADAPYAATGSRFIMTITANVLRNDLPFADKYHGFDVIIPTSLGLHDGLPHALYAYGLAQNAGSTTALLSNTPMTIRCGADAGGGIPGGGTVIPAGISSVQYTLTQPDNIIYSPSPGTSVSCSGLGSTSTYYIPDTTQSYAFRYVPGWPDTSYSIAFVTPAATLRTFGRFTTAEYSGPPTHRQVTIAASPCTFAPPLSTGSSTQAYFSVGVDPMPGPGWSYMVLRPNTLYYFNVTTFFGGWEHCPTTGCGQTFEYSPASP